MDTSAEKNLHQLLSLNPLDNKNSEKIKKIGDKILKNKNKSKNNKKKRLRKKFVEEIVIPKTENSIDKNETNTGFLDNLIIKHPHKQIIIIQPSMDNDINE